MQSKVFFPNLRTKYNSLVHYYDLFNASDHIIYNLLLFLKQYEMTFLLLTIAARSNLNFEQIIVPQELLLPSTYDEVPTVSEAFQKHLYRQTIWQ